MNASLTAFAKRTATCKGCGMSLAQRQSRRKPKRRRGQNASDK